MKKLLGTDLDGTLFYPKHRFKMIGKSYVSFVRSFIDEGNFLTLVSGRNKYYGFKVQKRLKRPISIIGCNGSFIVHNNETIFQKGVDPDIGLEVVKYILDKYNPIGFFLMDDSKELILLSKFSTFLFQIGYKFWHFNEFVYREPYVISPKRFYNAIKEGRALKIMPMFGISKKSKQVACEINKDIYHKFGDKIETSWSEHFIEITAKGCDKSSALKFLGDYLKINHCDIYVVGDSGNDIPMFKEFHENSFVIDHASLSVSKYAKHSIKSFDEIKHFISERKESNYE